MPALGKLNPNINRIQIEKNNHHKYVIRPAKNQTKRLIRSWAQERCVGKTRVPDWAVDAASSPHSAPTGRRRHVCVIDATPALHRPAKGMFNPQIGIISNGLSVSLCAHYLMLCMQPRSIVNTVLYNIVLLIDKKWIQLK
jgi:hypothetical protein